MSNRSESVAAGFLGAILVSPLFIVLYLYGAFAEGYVLSRLWTWYAVPHSLPALSWQTCAAASRAYCVITARAPRAQPADTRDASTKAVESLGYFAVPWLSLLVGWWLK